MQVRKEKKYCILTHIYGIYKNGTDKPIRRAGIETDVGKGLVDIEGEGENGTNWESRTDIYTLPCVKQLASGKLLYSLGSSAEHSVVTEMRGMVGGMGDG